MKGVWAWKRKGRENSIPGGRSDVIKVICVGVIFLGHLLRAMNSEIIEGRLNQTLSARLDFYLVDIEKLLEICNYGLDIRKLNF